MTASNARGKLCVGSSSSLRARSPAGAPPPSRAVVPAHTTRRTQDHHALQRSASHTRRTKRARHEQAADARVHRVSRDRCSADAHDCTCAASSSHVVLQSNHAWAGNSSSGSRAIALMQHPPRAVRIPKEWHEGCVHTLAPPSRAAAAGQRWCKAGPANESPARALPPLTYQRDAGGMRQRACTQCSTASTRQGRREAFASPWRVVSARGGVRGIVR